MNEFSGNDFIFKLFFHEFYCWLSDGPVWLVIITLKSKISLKLTELLAFQNFHLKKHPVVGRHQGLHLVCCSIPNFSPLLFFCKIDEYWERGGGSKNHFPRIGQTISTPKNHYSDKYVFQVYCELLYKNFVVIQFLYCYGTKVYIYKYIYNLYIYKQICIWRWTPGDKAVVPAPELPFTYRISIALVPAPELSLLWRHISPFKNMTSQERQLWSGNESYRNSVRERQLWSGNDGFVTWRSPSDT